MSTDIPAVIQAAISRVPSVKPADAAAAATNVQTDLAAAGVQLIGDLPAAVPTADPSAVMVGRTIYPRDVDPAQWLAQARNLLALAALAKAEPPAEQIDALTDAIDQAARGNVRSSRDIARVLARQGWTRTSK
jgi:hypothetical protein